MPGIHPPDEAQGQRDFAQGHAVERLYPGLPESVPLKGLYLSEPPPTLSRPFVYASFVASLDGRIALPDPKTQTHTVPRATANPRDWRLFQELAARADVLVTTGRYMRDLAAGVAQDSLPIGGEPRFSDLIEWRRAQGRPPQPAVAIVSASLNMPIPAELLRSGRKIYAVAGAAADPARLHELEAAGVRVLTGGEGLRVRGRDLIAALDKEGFRAIDMVAGSELFNTLLADGVLDRLYLTQVCKILGGLSFDTLVKGRVLEPPVSFSLSALHLDSHRGQQQLFAVYDLERSPA